MNDQFWKQWLCGSLMLWSIWSTLNAQTIQGSFSHNGTTRNYSVYLPANYATAAPCPVVFNLHGYGSNRIQQASLSQMNPLADTAGCIVVYPEGLPDGTGQRHWNAAYGTGVDDVGFIDALLDTILQRYQTNPARVYSMGLSNGAIMSHTLACELGHRFAAIGSVAGTMSQTQFNDCGTAAPMPVIHVHGTTDVVVAYTGSLVLLGVNPLINHWCNRNGLQTTATSTTSFPNTNLLDNSTADYLRYESGGTDLVHLIRVNNGGHSWPGSGVFISGNTNMDFSATAEIWRFFRQFDRILTTRTVPTTPWRAYVAPSTRTLHWETDRSKSYTLMVYNAYGQLVRQQGPGQNNCTLEALPQGWYVAHWQRGTEQYTYPFILP